MANREAYIIQSSHDNRRHFCIDAINEKEIMAFLEQDQARIKKFRHVRDLILNNQRNTDLYDKEDINEDCKDVTAIKMFKHGQNIRIYCKEFRSNNENFCIVVAELLPKKKDEGAKGKSKLLIKKVSGYEYTVVQRPKAENK